MPKTYQAILSAEAERNIEDAFLGIAPLLKNAEAHDQNSGGPLSFSHFSGCPSMKSTTCF